MTFTTLKGGVGGAAFDALGGADYADPDLTNWRQAYYGANYQRLTQVKASHDPARLFTFPQAV